MRKTPPIQVAPGWRVEQILTAGYKPRFRATNSDKTGPLRKSENSAAADYRALSGAQQ